MYEQIASLQAQIKKSRDNLSYFYSKNVIDKIYYNDMVAIASFINTLKQNKLTVLDLTVLQAIQVLTEYMNTKSE